MSCLAPGLGSLARCRQGGCRWCRTLCRCWAVLWEPLWWEQAQARGWCQGLGCECSQDLCTGCVWHCHCQAPDLFVWWGKGLACAVGMGLGRVETGNRSVHVGCRSLGL